jgi:O-6-methylguanine DNA methyltransferase
MFTRIKKEIGYSATKTPFGLMGIAHTSEGVCSILFPEEKPFKKSLSQKFPHSQIYKESTDTSGCADQLREYFYGKRITFELDLDLDLPLFHLKALNAVRTIPYGITLSYKDIAFKTGNPAAVRAVGNANARNPVPLVIPCHRVIKHDGSLGGYGGKLERKIFLLEHEKRNHQILN